MRTTPTAARRLLLLVVVCAGLVLPSSAAGASVTAQRHVDGTLGSHGWYVSNVHVYWTFAPPPDNSTGCDAKTLTADGVTAFHCVAAWNGPPVFNFDDAFNVGVDRTAPTLHGVPSRPPGANGWYTKPVKITFVGTDGTSGIAGCSSATYAGPDSANATVSGTCTDRAGNVGRASVQLAYDSDPPTLGRVTVKHGNRSVLLSWRCSADTRVVHVTRSGGKRSSRRSGAKNAPELLYSGTGSTYRDKGLRPGAKYRYTVTAFDTATNAASKTVAVRATGRLINPFPGQRVSARPHLAWLPVKGASYYNVQLIRGHRILSAWPTRTGLTLQRSWVYAGHRYELRPGLYRWYVWPGFGVRGKAKYGRLLGSSTFVYGG